MNLTVNEYVFWWLKAEYIHITLWLVTISLISAPSKQMLYLCELLHVKVLNNYKNKAR